MVEGEVITMPRSLGNGIHSLESLEHARWGRFRRFSSGKTVPTESELVKELKKERARNSAKGGACASQPNPSQRPNLSNQTCVCDSQCAFQARRSRMRVHQSRAAPPQSARSPLLNL
jgi:hypothetical protein